MMLRFSWTRRNDPVNLTGTLSQKLGGRDVPAIGLDFEDDVYVSPAAWPPPLLPPRPGQHLRQPLVDHPRGAQPPHPHVLEPCRAPLLGARDRDSAPSSSSTVRRSSASSFRSRCRSSECLLSSAAIRNLPCLSASIWFLSPRHTALHSAGGYTWHARARPPTNCT